MNHLLEYEENLLQNMAHQNHQDRDLIMAHQNLVDRLNQFMVHRNLNMGLRQSQNTVHQNQIMDLQNQNTVHLSQNMDLQNQHMALHQIKSHLIDLQSHLMDHQGHLMDHHQPYMEHRLHLLMEHHQNLNLLHMVHLL